ncbi:hypothetical protein GUJ93_ZPchr0013g37442 [Zizania palustris]|uniref:Uncharacterized protein n=1 Tax=Zizania palustris TaxID=103762 RepID=A0A8J6BXM3_ZIZPA|nr:hypothetical protein GUJ93_ZPchr0013g37442 [Zizania palustris]
MLRKIALVDMILVAAISENRRAPRGQEHGFVEAKWRPLDRVSRARGTRTLSQASAQDEGAADSLLVLLVFFVSLLDLSSCDFACQTATHRHGTRQVSPLLLLVNRGTSEFGFASTSFDPANIPRDCARMQIADSDDLVTVATDHSIKRST